MGTRTAHLPLLMRKRVGNEVNVWTSVKEGHSPGQNRSDQDRPVIRIEEDELAMWLTRGLWPGKGMPLANDEAMYLESTPQRKKKRTKGNGINCLI